jgi:hypothetical protein
MQSSYWRSMVLQSLVGMSRKYAMNYEGKTTRCFGAIPAGADNNTNVMNL